ncbi:hypothetical protein L218DRAFT_1059433 [Marasmius fiardii PR-910]|nr:hypothetical protein L218DRAFT_1059433 [Marasmius fiardii PR-910]
MSTNHPSTHAFEILLCYSSQKERNLVFWKGIVVPTLITALGLFLYGLYILLFRFGIMMLKARPQSREHLFHKASLAILFCLSSLAVPVNLAYDIRSIAMAFWGTDLHFSVMKAGVGLCIIRIVFFLLEGYALNYPRDYILLIYITFKSLTIDMILIYRFFTISRYPKRFMAIPMVIFTITDVGATISGIWVQTTILKTVVSDSERETVATLAGILLGCNAILQILLTLVIACQIWNGHRRNQLLFPKQSGTRLTTVICIFLESGAIYLVALGAFIFYAVQSQCLGVDFGSIVTQLAGIAPTLIIVRVNLPKYKNSSTIGSDGSSLHHDHSTRPTVGYTRSVPDDIVLDIARKKPSEA